ncbi:28457_t:CDS:2 [Dentiscutata erythropus]|uniref:28457_t:CDS:1 n=1 Tax=Dentiscutata erythropus TaxID=1348616 RepID=A0A9N8VBA8_9GLOM|nr:28457_t:CDS:2 [Dentiscutata erythropus]
MSTVDSGYAILYANCSQADDDKLLSLRCTLSANFISYNQVSQDRTAILYQLSRQNISFNGIYTKDKPELIWPSMIIWGLPIIINLILAIIIVIHAAPSKKEMDDMDEKISEDLNKLIKQIFKKVQEKISEIIEKTSNDISGKINEINGDVKEISNKIRKKITDKINYEKISEIIYKVYNELSQKSNNKAESSNQEISIDIEVLAEIKLSPEMQKEIFARIRDKIIAVLLDELFDIVQEEFFKLLDEKILAAMEEEMKEILKEKTFAKENDNEEVWSTMRSEFRDLLENISKETKKQILNKISEKNFKKDKKNSDVLQKIPNEVDAEKFFEEMQNTIDELTDEI